MSLRISLLTVLSLVFASAPAAALVIDNFEEGDFNLVDDTTTPGPTQAEESGLDPNNVIGGVRLHTANASGLTGLVATAILVTTPADDSVAMTNANSGGVFTYYYDGIPGGTIQTTNGALNLDLSAFDRIRLDLPAVAGTEAAVRITLYDSNSTHINLLTPVTQGINDFLFSEFGSVDLTDVQSIRVAFSGISPGNSITLSSIQAIPEPGTALLLGAGLVGLAVRRRSNA